MNRSLVAFLVAPLWVPLVMIPLASPYMFSSPNQGPWVAITTLLGVVFGYECALVFGLPAFAVLRSRQMTTFWIAPVLGFIIGAVTWLIFMTVFALMMSDGHLSTAALGIKPTLGDPVKMLFTVGPGGLGAVVGATLWLIARPDRPVKAPQRTILDRSCDDPVTDKRGVHVTEGEGQPSTTFLPALKKSRGYRLSSA